MEPDTATPAAARVPAPVRVRAAAAGDAPLRLEASPRRQPANRSHSVVKKELIDYVGESLGARSFADLGGVWAVNGTYSFHALSNGFEQGTLVDTHLTEALADRAALEPRLRVIQGNFGDASVAASVGQVDAVLLFDVLLHQVAPDWREVLSMYAAHTDCYVIVNPQWIGRERVVRLLDLGEDEYFQNVPHQRDEGIYEDLFERLDQVHPDHGGRPWRDVHHIWQWGLSDASLVGALHDLGYRIQRFVNNGAFCGLPRFECHGFVFAR
jgi:hypothetical protein